MDFATKQAELDSITWYHEFDFGNGLRTTTHCPHIEDHRKLWRFIKSHLSTTDFRGKTVLDIGSWDGYWSFFAEKQGARSVLASDDLGQNWSAGRGIHLAKELLGSSIEINQNLSVYNLASLNRKFDVILFLGVYYHLHDPFYALAQIRHCCHPETIVIVDGPIARTLGQYEALYNFSRHACEWLPSEEALQQILQATYFKPAPTNYLYTAEDYQRAMVPPPPPVPPGRLGWRWRLKMCLDALRGSREDIKKRIDGVLPPEVNPLLDPYINTNRVCITCSPYEGVVGLHNYRPPFGLHVYDPRFRDAPLRQAA